MPNKEVKPTSQNRYNNKPAKRSGEKDIDQKRNPEEEVVQDKGSKNDKPKMQNKSATK